MEKLIELLNEKGWKPWGNEKGIWKFIVRKRGRSIERPQSQYMIYFYDKDDCCFMAYSLRELVSNESGLWQFCVENRMVVRKRQWTNRWWWEPEKCFDYKDYEYRIIESALCSEDKLEQFLVDNIKL